MARMGMIDGTFIWGWRKERTKYFYYSDIIFSQSKVFFHRKDQDFKWKTMDDLRGLTIGLTIGYSPSPEFDIALAEGKIEVYKVPRDIQNFKKIVYKRIDVFPCAMFVGYSLLSNNFPTSVANLITNHPKPLMIDKYHLLLSKKNKKLLTLFNKGLKKLRNKGVIKKLFEDMYLKNQ